MGFNGREEYRGYWVRQWDSGGTSWVGVFREERDHTTVKSFRGATCVAVGKAWIDEQCGGPIGEDRPMFDAGAMQDAIEQGVMRAMMNKDANDREFERQEREAKQAADRLRELSPAQLMSLGMLGLREMPENRGVIEAAFKTKAKEVHPDCGGDALRFQMLTEAKEMLLAIIQ